MSLLEKLKYKLAGRYLMKNFTRWVPLIAATAYVVSTVLRGLGKLTQAQAIEAAVQSMGLPTTISPEELGAAAGIGFGLFVKFKLLIRAAIDPAGAAAAKEPVIKGEAEHEAFVAEVDKNRAEGMPFEAARKAAVVAVVSDRKS